MLWPGLRMLNPTAPKNSQMLLPLLRVTASMEIHAHINNAKILILLKKLKLILRTVLHAGHLKLVPENHGAGTQLIKILTACMDQKTKDLTTVKLILAESTNMLILKLPLFQTLLPLRNSPNILTGMITSGALDALTLTFNPTD
jgi:hypothetical protein